jgi:hypothetical protein
MKTVVVTENCVSLPTKVANSLEGQGMTLQLVKRKPVQEVFSKEFLEDLGKHYNLTDLYFEFGILAWSKNATK